MLKQLTEEAEELLTFLEKTLGAMSTMAMYV